jgi:hypothetical protein
LASLRPLSDVSVASFDRDLHALSVGVNGRTPRSVLRNICVYRHEQRSALAPISSREPGSPPGTRKAPLVISQPAPTRREIRKGQVDGSAALAFTRKRLPARSRSPPQSSSPRVGRRSVLCGRSPALRDFPDQPFGPRRQRGSGGPICPIAAAIDCCIEVDVVAAPHEKGARAHAARRDRIGDGAAASETLLRTAGLRPERASAGAWRGSPLPSSPRLRSGLRRRRARHRGLLWQLIPAPALACRMPAGLVTTLPWAWPSPASFGPIRRKTLRPPSDRTGFRRSVEARRWRT